MRRTHIQEVCMCMLPSEIDMNGGWGREANPGGRGRSIEKVNLS